MLTTPDNKIFFVYIIASRSRVLYIGMTNNLERRIFEHINGIFEGFTKKYHCHYLVYFEKFDSPFEAILREKVLKGWRREKKIHLIETINPKWEDLAQKL
jgi:putative endonuclease